jgi:transcriptional regulator with XRE-family HTH domain
VWIRPRDQKIVGRTLAEARLAAEVTQQQLARKLRKPQSFVSSYESGQRRVDVLEFLTILRAIGGKPLKVLAAIEKLFSK